MSLSHIIPDHAQSVGSRRANQNDALLGKRNIERQIRSPLSRRELLCYSSTHQQTSMICT